MKKSKNLKSRFALVQFVELSDGESEDLCTIHGIGNFSGGKVLRGKRNISKIKKLRNQEGPKKILSFYITDGKKKPIKEYSDLESLKKYFVNLFDEENLIKRSMYVENLDTEELIPISELL